MRIFKHIHVGLAVYALSFITLIQLNIPTDENLLNFILFASITGYNFVKYFGLAKFHHRSLANWLRVIQVFSLICFILMVYYLLKLKFITILIVCLMGLITFFYATPFLPKRLFVDNNYNLRTITGLKVYVIALVWTVVTVTIPIVNTNYPVDFDVMIMSFQRYLFVVVLILPFDIRDLRYDSLKLATIPQKLGIRNTKFLGVLLLVVFLLLEFLKDTLSYNQVTIKFAITLVTALFIVFSSKDRGRAYSAFWVEGLPIFWLFMEVMFF